MLVCAGLGSLHHPYSKLISGTSFTQKYFSSLLKKVHVQCMYPHARHMLPS